jgi:arogenate dehydrogenase (NADP+)
VALISHLPVLVGAALLAAADRAGASTGVGALARFLASSGFADTTRVGGGNPELGTLMARTNRQALLQALAAYRLEIGDLEALVAGERWSDLEGRLGAAQALRPAYLGADPPTGGHGPAADDRPAGAT